jgi:hypothetical protein
MPDVDATGKKILFFPSVNRKTDKCSTDDGESVGEGIVVKNDVRLRTTKGDSIKESNCS